MSFPSTSKHLHLSFWVLLGTQAVSCANHRAESEIYEGTIAQPFVTQTSPIGRDQASANRMIIRSTSGNREYSVEIPEGAEDYDIEIPLEHEADTMGGGGMGGGIGDANPQLTDAEIIASMPSHSAADSKDAAILNKSLQLAPEQGQGPSYTLGLARVNDYYLRNNFELALIEVNQLLSYYPNSPQLFKMKGTLHLKLQNKQLALQAWTNALRLDPEDTRLRRALDQLQKK